MADTYILWQQLLARSFFHTHKGPIVLFVDDEELAKLFPESEDPARGLASAVLERVRPQSGKSMFKATMSALRNWQKDTRGMPPPILPVVAISVLAATRMRADSAARSTNYYLRLAQALLPDADSSTTQNLRENLSSGAFVDVVEMWRSLDKWIETQQGAVGTSTIRGHEHLSRIGYPLSQAIVRHSDRAQLTRFFLALDFELHTPPPSKVLIDSLEIWCAAKLNRLSETFIRSMNDPETRRLLAEVVEAHARAWDGQVLTSDGQPLINMRLALNTEAWEANWLFEVPTDGPSSLTLYTAKEKELVLADSTGRYYRAKGSPEVTGTQVREGLRIRGHGFTAEFHGSPTVFFCLDPEIGTWSSVTGLIPYEEHLLLADSAYVMDVQRVLEEAADSGWGTMPQRKSHLIGGFALFRNVRFSNGQKLDSTLSRFPKLRRIGVTPVSAPRPRIVRGLPIAKGISTSHYLAGGEPDLLLPSYPEPRHVEVVLDGFREELLANGFPLELRRFIDRTGPHTIEVDKTWEIRFTTLEEGPNPEPPSGTASLGWTERGTMTSVIEDFAVIGANVDGPDIFTSFFGLRGRDESWLLFADGRAEELTEPAQCGHTLTGRDIQLPRFEVHTPPSARWLAQRRGRLWRLIEIGVSTPFECELETDVVAAWKRACVDSNARRLWDLQISMAGSGA